MSEEDIIRKIVIAKNDTQESYEKLKRSYEELQEADHIKTDFVSVVTHELRTPLTIIRNNLEMFLDGTFGELNEVQHESLEILFKNVERLIKLVRDCQEMSQIYAGRVKLDYERIPIREMFEKIVSDMMFLSEEKGQELSLYISDDIQMVECDVDKITQVLTNLLQNAIKFTPNGGNIRVRVKSGDDNNIIIVEVSDNGIGIPEKEQKNIFKQFYEVNSPTKHETKGTGLGLSIAKGIVEAHGGKIWVESTPKVGSTFSFTLKGGR